MHGLEVRFTDYVRSHHEIPMTLSQLPGKRGYDNSVTDGWGRPILLERNGQVIRLISYGKDGIPGGVGDDSDIIQEFLLPKSQ